MAKMGCLLIILSTVALCVIVVIPVLPFLNNSPEIDRFMQPLLCQPGETVRREQYSYQDFEGTAYSMNVYCVNNDEVERDVSARWFIMGAVAFTVPFLIGLFMFIYGVNRYSKNRVATLTTASLGNTGWAMPQSSMMSVNTTSSGVGKATLTQRLKELQDARDAGLISSIEFDKARQQILDSMED
jgi:hypothetical protein